MVEGRQEISSWDITNPLGLVERIYVYLHVVFDICSCYVVGWMEAEPEGSALAGRLIEETCHKHVVEHRVLTLRFEGGGR